MKKETVEDLLTNDSFVRWIQGEADKKEQKKWNRWLEEDPARDYKVLQAKRLYHTLQFKEETPNTIGELNKLRQAIANQEKFHQTSKKKKSYWSTAAVIAVLLIILPTVAVYFGWDMGAKEQIEETAFTTVQTDYGEIQNLSFPDGSNVVLNANSKLTFPSTFSDGDVEMELDGEAQFNVASKKGDKERTFSVRTADGTVSVLGTRFNVNTRMNSTEVVLEEGSVLFEAVAKKISGNSKQPLSYIMKPGEMLTFGLNDQEISVQQVDTDLYTSWRNLELRLDNTPLWQIANRIEHTYGAEVDFMDDKLRDMRFYGTVPNKNLSVLLEGLRVLLDEPISKDSNKIIIGSE